MKMDLLQERGSRAIKEVILILNRSPNQSA